MDPPPPILKRHLILHGSATIRCQSEVKMVVPRGEEVETQLETHRRHGVKAAVAATPLPYLR